jgi:hypothetical protein
MYTIENNGFRCYEVGNYKPNGTFVVLETYESQEDAQKMIRYLNGGAVGTLPKTHKMLEQERKDQEEAEEYLQMSDEQESFLQWLQFK